MKKKTKKVINKIIQQFDFKRVHKVMILLDWNWVVGGVPSVPILKQFAKNRLMEAAIERLKDTELNHNVPYVISSGGFEVSAYCNKKKTKINYLELKFVLSQQEMEIKKK